MKGGAAVSTVWGGVAGLAPGMVPSVEQADSAIFCSRVSHILHRRVHSRRLAHAQNGPPSADRGQLSLHKLQPGRVRV